MAGRRNVWALPAGLSAQRENGDERGGGGAPREPRLQAHSRHRGRARAEREAGRALVDYITERGPVRRGGHQALKSARVARHAAPRSPHTQAKQSETCKQTQ